MKQVICVTASTLSSERVFSSGGNLVNERRSCLSPENMDQLLYCMKMLLPAIHMYNWRAINQYITILRQYTTLSIGVLQQYLWIAAYIHCGNVHLSTYRCCCCRHAMTCYVSIQLLTLTFGHVLVQFMIVWQLITENGSLRFCKRLVCAWSYITEFKTC